jgi:hypothetical protein
MDYYALVFNAELLVSSGGEGVYVGVGWVAVGGAGGGGGFLSNTAAAPLHNTKIGARHYLRYVYAATNNQAKVMFQWISLNKIDKQIKAKLYFTFCKILLYLAFLCWPTGDGMT